jgi:hypothetical protein
MEQFDSIGQGLSHEGDNFLSNWRRKDGREQAMKEAREKTLNGTPHFVAFLDGKYEVRSIQDIEAVMKEDINKLNAPLFI